MSMIHNILSAYAGNPCAPVEEIAEVLGEKDVKRLRGNIHQVANQGHLERKRDDVTGKPGYHLTSAGRKKLDELNKGGKPAPTRKRAASKAETPAASTGTDPVPGTDREIIDLTTENHMMSEQLANLHNALAELLPPEWPIDPSDMSTEQIVAALTEVITELRSRTECTLDVAEDPALQVNGSAAGYLVAAYKRKPRRVTEEPAARKHALAAVRNGAQWADVFALVPIASARRGAVWSTQ